jgi:hypothetical protein
MRAVPGEEHHDEDGEDEMDKLTTLGINNQNMYERGQVTLDDDGILHWPVLFVYPEHGQTDFIETFDENHK